MKRCRLAFLTLMLVGLSGIPGVDGQQPGQGTVTGGERNNAITQNAAIADIPVSGEGFKVFRTVHADVVAIDQPYVINRLGASQPEGMIFVLKSDLVPKDQTKELCYDNFKLRKGKRPRPLVLRMNVGDLLEIHFENWLQSLDPKFPPPTDGKATNDLAPKRPFVQLTRYAGIHVNGLDLVPQKVGDPAGIKSDGSWVGRNPSGLLQPRASAAKDKPEEQSITYRLYAREAGTFLLTSGADTTVHQLNAGLFGAVNVQPRGAEWYRSQTTRCEMQAATLKQIDLRALEQTPATYQPPPKLDKEQATPESDAAIVPGLTPMSLRTAAQGGQAQVQANVYIDAQGRIYSKFRQPLINYFAVFKDDKECPSAVKGKPVLSMTKAIPAPGAPVCPFELDGENTYKREIEQLDNGFVTYPLRVLFATKPVPGDPRPRLGIDLASDATVARSADLNKYSWVVTNPGTVATTKGTPVVAGKTYLVQGQEKDEGGKKKRTLTIQECQLHLVHSDLTALITGPNAGTFPISQDGPEFYTNPGSPSRRQPYRELTIIYHQAGNTVQAFPQWSNNNLFNMINAGMDEFAINYGIAAIGPEIVANRLGVGPMGNSQQPKGTSGKSTAPQANQPNDAVDLKYEEFFLSSWCVGDPAMIVDVPANAPNAMVDNPDNGSKIIGTVEDDPVSFGNFKKPNGQRPTKAFYPDDPSNVYHSYMRDHTKMRVLHAGPGPAHVHHLHAHQWLKSPKSPEATYLDSQLILPGSAYTLEMTYNGSGNRNQTVGDSIFHCHFYPHFAKGMWSLWRVHDTFEEGTELKPNGECVSDKPNRALPDGEIAAGTPTPAVIPMPSLGMAPMPAPVQLTDLFPWYDSGTGKGRRITVIPKNWARLLHKFDADHDGTLSGKERDTWHKAIDDAIKANRENKLKGYDLQLTPWEHGSTVPRTGPKSTVYAGIDDNNLHIRVFDPAGKIELESNEKKSPGKSGEVLTKLTELKDRLPGLYPPHPLTPGEKAQVLDDLKQIFGLTMQYGEPDYHWVWYAQYDNPGYPFFIPGVSGHRPPHPPLDMAWKEKEQVKQVTDVQIQSNQPLDLEDHKSRWTKETIESQLKLDPATSVVQPGEVQYLDGGLPRHMVLGGDIVSQYNTRWDFSKDFVKPDPKDKSKHIGGLYAFQLPEDGTPIEKAAMKAHSTRTHKTALPENGDAGNFILNGLQPIHGAPYADPSVTDDGNSSGIDRRYQAAVIQTDVVLNKKGWHYPQSRFITLWEDVAPTIKNDRAPEPFFIRTATDDATELWHTNLVPNYYELDDFQVRTPTDVIGQHIHLVKFDVTASDGGSNGWNYEDGTFGPSEVRERIHAIMNTGGLYGFDEDTGYVNKAKQGNLAVWLNRFAYPPRKKADGSGVVGDSENGLFGQPPAGQNWEGAMTTIQRWAIDPLLNWQGQDRTLRTVFTHDHLGPSTHQQVGLYAGVLVEPQGSQWYLADGNPMYTRVDGGPTSWQAMIVTANPENSHREYAIEFQDMQLAYTAESKVGPLGSNKLFMPKTAKNHDGNPDAPAAFFIGQAATTEQLNIPDETNRKKFIVDGLNKSILPQEFPKLFGEYGILLSPDAKVTVLQEGTFAGGYLNGEWRIDQPPLQPGGAVNGGDFYIVKASNPIPNPAAKVPGQPPGFATCLSVFTPSIPPGFTDPEHAVNPNPGDRGVNGILGNIGTPNGKLPQGTTVEGPNADISNSRFGNGAPYPSLVSTRANGTYSMNYRNEPVQLRVKSGDPKQTDLAFAFSSSFDRADKALSEQPQKNDPINPARPNDPYKFPPPLMPWLPKDNPGGPQGTDPFTPLIRGYPGDDIQIRTLVGAHLQPHAFSIHGVHWLAQPSYHNSGYRNVQAMGISEHYEMRFKMPSAASARQGKGKDVVKDGADYFYSANTGAVGLSNGVWGIMRSYNHEMSSLKPLVNNPPKRFPAPIDYKQRFDEALAKNPKATQTFRIVATTAARALPGGMLIYNRRANQANKNLFSDPDAVLFVRESDLDIDGKLKEGVRVEPLILRAAAGDWIKVTLTNKLCTSDPKVTTFTEGRSFRYGNPFNDLPNLPGDKNPNNPPPTVGEVQMKISQRIGLHPQLLSYDVTKANGINVGFNPDSTVGPEGSIDYYWYAGEIVQRDGETITTPVEFGATNLVGADLILQTQFGLVGAMIVEPLGSTWSDDTNTHAFSTVTKRSGEAFRECVLVMQNMVKKLSPGREDLASQIDGRDAGFGAVNYRTENFGSRGPRPVVTADVGFGEIFSNTLLFPNPANKPKSTSPIGPPETPIFEAAAGTPTRFRVVMPSSTSANSAAQPVVFALHGHGWQDEPYIRNAREIGHNAMAQFIGSQHVTVTQKYDIVIDSAGGPFQVPGDYLYQAFNQEQKMGIWGLFRVTK